MGFVQGKNKNPRLFGQQKNGRYVVPIHNSYNALIGKLILYIKVRGIVLEKRFVPIAVFLVSLFILESCPVLRPVEAAPTTLVVPDDFPTIQGAIDAAGVGTTIFVRNGTYFENLFIGKTLTLIGEDRRGTVIDGGKTGDVIFVEANGVKISGFTVRNSGTEFPNSGILIYNSTGCYLSNNNVTNNNFGIRFDSSSHNEVAQNNMQANAKGIEMAWSDNNTIGYNTLSGLFGISLGESRNNTIIGNTLRLLKGQLGDTAINMQLKSSHNVIVQNNIAEYGGRRFTYGIHADNSTGNLMERNEIDTTRYCLWITNSNGTKIVLNDLRNKDDITYKLYMQYSQQSNVYHNNFFGADTARPYFSTETLWDAGYPSGGNYWQGQAKSDFYRGVYQNESGSDGIVDSPYAIDGTNSDKYPFMNPYREPEFQISTMPNSLIFYTSQSKTGAIVVTSINSFILPVNITAVWIDSAPSNVSYSLSKNTVTPPPNGRDALNLTVETHPVASIGSYLLRVYGDGGNLSRFMDLEIQIVPLSFDKTPPSITGLTQFPSQGILALNQSVTIEARVTDLESDISSIMLRYSSDNGSTWSELPMLFDATGGSYEAVIPGFGSSTDVKYYISAYDNAGNVKTLDNLGIFYKYSVSASSTTKDPSHVSCLLSEVTVRQGGTIVVSGFITPTHSNESLTLKYTKPDNSTIIRTVTSNSTSGFLDSYAPDSPGSWSVQVEWQGDSTHDKSSILKTFVVEAGLFGLPLEVIILIVVVIAGAGIVGFFFWRRGRSPSGRALQPSVSAKKAEESAEEAEKPAEKAKKSAKKAEKFNQQAAETDPKTE